MKNRMSMFFAGIIIMVSGSFFVADARIGYTEWQNFTNGYVINDVVVADTCAWIATEGGLVHITLADTQVTFYNKVDHDLPINQLQALALSSTGKLWIATREGLVSFFNNTWTVYTTETTNLPENNLISVAIAPDNALWIGTFEHGVVRFDGTTWTTYSMADGMGSNKVQCVAFTSDSRVWCGTNLGYSVFDGSAWETYNRYTSGLPNNLVLDIKVDAQDELWMATFSGLAHFDGDSTWVVYKSSTSSLPNNNVYSLAMGSQGKVWIGTRAGIVTLQDTVWTTVTIDTNSLPSEVITVLTFDADDNLWVGTNQGLALFNQSTTQWQSLSTSMSLIPSNDVTAIQKDFNGAMWVGTKANGLGKLYGASWSIFTSSNSVMQVDKVNAILTTTDGDVWVGTGNEARFDGNLVRIDSTGTMTPYNTHATGLPGYNVQELYQAPDEMLWVGTAGNEGASGEEGGIGLFDRDTTWTIYDIHTSGLTKNEIPAIARDIDGSMWFSVAEGYMSSGVGVMRFDATDSSWTSYATYNSGLAADFVRDILVDEHGDKWFATYGGGVSVLSGTTWTTYNTTNSALPSDFVNVLRQDDQGDVWMGTYEGIAVFDRTSSWKVFTEQNSGLLHNYINTIYIDNTNNKWIGTQGGMTVCNTCTGGEISGIAPFARSASEQNGMALVFSNPVSGMLTLGVTGNAGGKVSYAICNLAGDVIAQIANGSQHATALWNTATVVNGLYLVRATVPGVGSVFKSILVTH